MSGTDGGGASPDPARTSAGRDPILDARLHRPPARPDWIERARLLKDLDHAVLCPVVLVVAPAGFGKTTMVTQWLTSNRAPPLTAWVSLDTRDNDPAQLWTDVATTLERVGCRPDEDLTAPPVVGDAGEVFAGILPRLVRGLARLEDDLIILLDDFHVIQDPACHRQVEFLVAHLPPQVHLVIITRADPGLRLGRLRASGQLAEIRASDLAFTAAEASALLAAEQVVLSDEALRDLVDRTEGWAAGLYLAALSMSGQSDPDAFVREVSGTNRFIGDYLTEEVLSTHSVAVRDFIQEVSILERFSPALCDFVTGGNGSVAILHDLERTNLFLVPLDENRTWYRFHHLFASVARSELELEHPEQVEPLHARAARWFTDHGHIDEAVRHSLASGLTGEAARLVQANWLDYVGDGRSATVLRWLEALGETAAEDPAARVTTAWMAALTGDEAALNDQLARLEQQDDVGVLPDGCHSIESATSLIRGLFGYGGPIEMRLAGQRALELETDGRSPFYSMAHQAAGHAAYVDGDLEVAVTLLARASDNEAAPPIIRVLAAACRSMAEDELDHHEESLALAEQAMRLVHQHRLGAMPQAAPAFSALGRAQVVSGDLQAAAATVAKGLALRRKNPTQGPWGNLHHLLAAARVAAAADESVMAQQLLDEAKARMDRFPEGMECMRQRWHVIQQQIRSPLSHDQVSEALTERELEVLRLLQGSLSLSGIADELYVSPNTVKTHARAVYRKLGASSRLEAVEIARHRMLV